MMTRAGATILIAGFAFVAALANPPAENSVYSASASQGAGDGLLLARLGFLGEPAGGDRGHYGCGESNRDRAVRPGHKTAGAASVPPPQRRVQGLRYRGDGLRQVPG